MVISENNILKIAIIFLSLFSVGKVSAVTWGNQVTITGDLLYESEASMVFIETSGNQNPDGCGNDRYIIIDTSQSNFDKVYDIVMRSYEGSLNVSIQYDSC